MLLLAPFGRSAAIKCGLENMDWVQLKHGLGIDADCGLRNGYKVRTTDYVGKNGANWF